MINHMDMYLQRVPHTHATLPYTTRLLAPSLEHGVSGYFVCVFQLPCLLWMFPWVCQYPRYDLMASTGAVLFILDHFRCCCRRHRTRRWDLEFEARLRWHSTSTHVSFSVSEMRFTYVGFVMTTATPCSVSGV